MRKLVLLFLASCGSRTALDLPAPQSSEHGARTPVSNVTAIAVGGFHTCVLFMDGTVRCFGSALYGQLGNGTSATATSCPTSDTTSEPCGRAPVKVDRLARATSVTAGETHSCALEDGKVWCWGNNAHGELGDGTFVQRDTPVLALDGATKVVAGINHTCAIVGAAGHVSCWGRNDLGQLGDGSTANRATPSEVAGVSNIVALNLGRAATCALRADGVSVCWSYKGMFTNPASGCAIRSEGTFFCGWNCGNEDFVPRSADASEQMSCAVDGNATLHCWSPLFTPDHPCPCGDDVCSMIVDVGRATDVSVGFQHACALLDDSTVRCFGDDTFGQLGDGSNGAFTMVPRIVVW